MLVDWAEDGARLRNIGRAFLTAERVNSEVARVTGLNKTGGQGEGHGVVGGKKGGGLIYGEEG